MKLVRKRFGRYQDRAIDLYTFSNDGGLVVSLTNYGGIITAIKTPDRQGKPGIVTLGYDRLEEYIDDTGYLGCLIGRFADVISEGRFQIGGKVHHLTCNEGRHHLNGGLEGFGKKVWEAEPVREERGCGLALSLISPEGDEGYPGTVDVQARYLLTADNGLIIEYKAASDTPTIINLTQHICFNLAGKGTIYDHLLQINASGYTPVDQDRIPHGSLKSVEDTALDFRSGKQIGRALKEAEAGTLIEGGFDHNFVLDGNDSADKAAARLFHPESGRVVEVYTSKPGLRLYTGNSLNKSMIGKGGVPFSRHGGICLGTQHFPDSPNKRAFPSVILQPGQVYRQMTKYLFGLQR